VVFERWAKGGVRLLGHKGSLLPPDFGGVVPRSVIPSEIPSVTPRGERVLRLVFGAKEL